ncbi:hypothetical protein BF95_01410 [Sphingobium sp. Ant17]|nr:hypothetical protein BF95_01410 [Sphingobium sp. Ant17]
MRVGIEQHDMLAAQRQFAGDVGGERGLADAAFLVEQRDDHGVALHTGKPGFACGAKRCSPCRFSVVHRNGALLLKVMYFLLGKLEGPQTRAVIGFPVFSYS